MIATVLSAGGFAGALLSIFAFFQVSRGAWKGQSKLFQLSNALAAVLLIAYGWYYHAYPNVLLNLVWLAIAMATLMRFRRKA